MVDVKDIYDIINDSDTMIELENVKADSDLKEFGADSLDMMTVLLNVQEKYGIEIPDDKIEDLSTIQKIADFISQMT